MAALRRSRRSRAQRDVAAGVGALGAAAIGWAYLAADGAGAGPTAAGIGMVLAGCGTAWIVGAWAGRRRGGAPGKAAPLWQLRD